MNAKSIEQLLEEDKQDENLQMCRRIREERDLKFKTVDALFTHLEKMPGKGHKAVVKSGSAKTVRNRNSALPTAPSVVGETAG